MKYRPVQHPIKKHIVLLGGLLFALATLWLAWPQCQTNCSCPNQVALSSQPPPGAILAGTEAPLPQFMSDIQFSLIAKNHSEADYRSTTRVIKAGEDFFRHEFPDNSAWGQKDILIKNRSDNWLVNRFSKDALHYSSRAQPTSVKLPVFYASGFQGELLAGEEVDFFVKNQAKKTIDGDNVIYELSSAEGNLVLFVDVTTDKPIKIDFFGNSKSPISYTISYETFERRVDFKPEVFQVPSGIEVRELTIPAEKKSSYEGWASEEPRLVNYYLKPDPQALLEVFQNLQPDKIYPIRMPLIELSAAILKKEPKLIPAFIDAAKQAAPPSRVWAALALRGCEIQQCQQVLASNPFDFEAEGMAQFLKFADAKDTRQRRLFRGSLDKHLAQFIVTGDKGSLDQVITFLDSRVNVTEGGQRDSWKPAPISSAPPGVVDIILKLGEGDPSIREFLQEKKKARSKSASEILQLLR